MEAIKATFAKCKEENRAALVTYVTAGFPTVDETVDILLGLENGGAGMSIAYCHHKAFAEKAFCSFLPHLERRVTANMKLV